MADRILIVDDDRDMCELIQFDLQTRGYDAQFSTVGAEAVQRLAREDIDVVLTDLNMPGLSGLDICRYVKENRPDIPVIMLTAFGSLETAIQAIRAGAYDFVTKPIELELIGAAIERALGHRRLQNKVKLLNDQIERVTGLDGFIGESQLMQAVYEQIVRLAQVDVPVLITGESGTGKEVAARALHHKSGRRQGPFVAVNCAALPESLLDSELFGHAEGAFTGSKGKRNGLFVQADNGTLFLDEIGEFPLSLQPKLLRVLEEQTVRPVGCDHEVSVNVRIVAATNRDLAAAVQQQTFRDDLFYRINVVHLQMPPLRSRGNDVLLLADYFLRKAAQRWGKTVQSISPNASAKLLAYTWPGNVRELRNAIEHALALTRFESLMVEDMPDSIRSCSTVACPNQDGRRQFPSLAEMEKDYIAEVLKAVDGNKVKAARLLGIDRKTLYRKLV